ncbi:hypothetical protein QZH41_003464 [Actinostola sp. cb2023]|nr:hypothetical protein QZH41_003464 [Actinostola sp. cb2023]
MVEEEQMEEREEEQIEEREEEQMEEWEEEQMEEREEEKERKQEQKKRKSEENERRQKEKERKQEEKERKQEEKERKQKEKERKQEEKEKMQKEKEKKKKDQETERNRMLSRNSLIMSEMSSFEEDDDTSTSHNVQADAREQRTSFDWSKCLFCKNATRKKDRQLINIVTFEACNSIKESAEAREDHQLLDILQTINYDLIAAEGKYHKACHATYTSKVNIKRKQHDASIKEENTFDEAFSQLLDTITQEFENGKAYDMNVLLRMFKKELGKMGVSAESYSKQKLKARLMTHYKEHLVFHQPPQQFKPEVVYSSSISLIDIINAASNCDPPDTAFGELSQKYEDIVLSTLRQNDCTRVDLVFDQYWPVSIKAGERSRRGESHALEVNIHSDSMQVPKQWSKFISV